MINWPLLEFDKLLDSYLKLRLTPEEEQRFWDQLDSDPRLMERARDIAFTAINANVFSPEQKDKAYMLVYYPAVQETLGDQKREPALEEFDEQLAAFLKQQMTAEQEAAFKEKLLADEALMKRAKVVALMIQQMNVVNQEVNEDYVSIIKAMNKNEYRVAAELVEHEPALYSRVGAYYDDPNEEEARLKELLKNGIDKEAYDRLKRSRYWINDPETEKIKKFPWKIIKVAAACLLCLFLIGGIKFYRTKQYNETIALAETYANAVTDVTIMDAPRYDQSDVSVDEVNRLINNVETDKDLKETASQLAKLYRDAMSMEGGVIKRNQAAIGWNAAVAYLKLGDHRHARSIVRSMTENCSDPRYLPKAKELLKALEKI